MTNRKQSNHAQQLGRWGENVAVSILKGRGFRIIEQNFRTSFGEIDIIAKIGDEIVFVEVKTRTNETFGYPEEAITRDKAAHILNAIDYYFQQNPHDMNLPYRIDVISIIGAPNQPNPQIEIFENAIH